MTLAQHAGALLARHWWPARSSGLARLLQPLAGLYGLLAAIHRRRTAARPLPVPRVLVVGNWVVGGAGKTPTVIALVRALQAAGRRPGVVSRGYGRHGHDVLSVDACSDAAQVGDEPLLIRRRTGTPVWVGRDRVAAGLRLIEHHPEVDVVVCDDGLQHHRLARDCAIVVFDERGAGNGRLLPAGPLREALPRQVPARTHILYTAGVPSTRLPGDVAERRLGRAWPLAAWLSADASQACDLARLSGRPLVAVAGLASPSKFFDMLEAAGLSLAQRLALPDHFAYESLPWPRDTDDVITTEKDAVKLLPQRMGRTRVWVVPLDLLLPADLVGRLLAELGAPRAANLP